MVIPLENYAFSKSDETRFGDEARSMDLKELRHRHDSIGTLNSDLKAEQLSRIYTERSLRYHRQLDTSRADYSVRPAFSDEKFMQWRTVESEYNATKDAIARTNEYIGALTTFNREKLQYTFSLRRIDVEMLKKFALSLACFIFFFIGAPLGALIRKGGLGTPAIIAVLFFVLYWVVDITGVKLAKDGAVSAATGVFISSLVLLPIGMLFTWNAINDKSLIDTEKVSAFFKKIRNTVMGRLKKTRIVYMGTPEFAVRPLDELIRKGFNVVGVVTVADKASGRGLKVNESPVKKYAVEHNIPVLQPWSVIHGDRYTGVTSFMINEGMDTGFIIFRDQCPIDDTDNAGTVHDKLMDLGANIVVQTVDALIDGKVELRSQKSFIQGDEVLRPAPKITRELCHIDWDRPAKEIHNLIRGLSPYPAAFTELEKDGKTIQLKIFESTVLTPEETEALVSGADRDIRPGDILSDGRSFMAVKTADAALRLEEIQLAGKKRMSAADFLKGFRDCTSYTTTKGTSSEVLDKYSA